MYFGYVEMQVLEAYVTTLLVIDFGSVVDKY